MIINDMVHIHGHHTLLIKIFYFILNLGLSLPLIIYHMDFLLFFLIFWKIFSHSKVVIFIFHLKYNYKKLMYHFKINIKYV